MKRKWGCIILVIVLLFTIGMDKLLMQASADETQIETLSSGQQAAAETEVQNDTSNEAPEESADTTKDDAKEDVAETKDNKSKNEEPPVEEQKKQDDSEAPEEKQQEEEADSEKAPEDEVLPQVENIVLPVEINYVLPEDPAIDVTAPTAYTDHSKKAEQMDAVIKNALADTDVKTLVEHTDKADAEQKAKKLLKNLETSVMEAKKSEDSVESYSDYTQIATTAETIAPPDATAETISGKKEAIKGWLVAATAGISLAYVDDEGAVVSEIRQGDIIPQEKIGSVRMLSNTDGIHLMSLTAPRASLATLIGLKQDLTVIKQVGPAGANDKWSVLVQGGKNNTDEAGTRRHAYGTLKAALQAINADTGANEFKITFVDDYKLDGNDLAALGNESGARVITRADQPTLIMTSKVKYQDGLGYQANQKVTIPNDASVYSCGFNAYYNDIYFAGNNLSFYGCQDNTTFDTVSFTGSVYGIFGGNNLRSDSSSGSRKNYELNVTNIKTTADHPIRYIVGGGREDDADGYGNITVNISDCTIYGSLIGGGMKADQTGDVVINAENSSLKEFNRIFGNSWWESLFARVNEHHSESDLIERFYTYGGAIYLAGRAPINGNATLNLNKIANDNGSWFSNKQPGDITGSAAINAVDTGFGGECGAGILSQQSQITSENKKIDISSTAQNSSIKKAVSVGQIFGFDELSLKNVKWWMGEALISYKSSYIGDYLNKYTGRMDLLGSTVTTYGGNATIEDTYMVSGCNLTYVNLSGRINNLHIIGSDNIATASLAYADNLGPLYGHIDPLKIDGIVDGGKIKWKPPTASEIPANRYCSLSNFPSEQAATNAASHFVAEDPGKHRLVTYGSTIFITNNTAPASGDYWLYRGDYENGTAEFFNAYQTFGEACSAMRWGGTNEYTILFKNGNTYFTDSDKYAIDDVDFTEYTLHLTNGTDNPGKTWLDWQKLSGAKWKFKKLCLETFHIRPSGGGILDVGVTEVVVADISGSYPQDALTFVTSGGTWNDGAKISLVNTSVSTIIKPVPQSDVINKCYISMKNCGNNTIITGSGGEISRDLTIDSENSTVNVIPANAGAYRNIGGNYTVNITGGKVTAMNNARVGGVSTISIKDKVLVSGKIFAGSSAAATGQTIVKVLGNVQIGDASNAGAGLYDFDALYIGDADHPKAELTIGNAAHAIPADLNYLVRGVNSRSGRLNLSNSGRLIMQQADERAVGSIVTDSSKTEIAIEYNAKTGKNNGKPLMVAESYQTGLVVPANSTLRVSTTLIPTHEGKTEYELITFAEGTPIVKTKFTWIADGRYYAKEGEGDLGTNQLVLRRDIYPPLVYQEQADPVNDGTWNDNEKRDSYQRKLTVYMYDLYRDAIDKKGEELVRADIGYKASTYAQAYVSTRDINQETYDDNRNTYQYTFNPDAGDFLFEEICDVTELGPGSTFTDINNGTHTIASNSFGYKFTMNRKMVFDQNTNYFLYIRDIAGNWTKFLLDTKAPEAKLGTVTVSDVSEDVYKYDFKKITFSDPEIVPPNGTSAVDDTSSIGGFKNSANATDFNTEVSDDVYYNLTGKDPWVYGQSTKLTKESDGTYSIEGITLGKEDILYLFAKDAYGNKTCKKLVLVNFDAQSGGNNGKTPTGIFTDGTNLKVTRAIANQPLADSQHPHTAYGDPKLGDSGRQFLYWYDSNDASMREVNFNTFIIPEWTTTFYPEWELPTITVSKKVTGAYGDKDYGFLFRFVFELGDGVKLPAGTTIACKGGVLDGYTVEKPSITSLTVGSEGEVEFRLKDGQTLAIQSPVKRARITLTETETRGHTVSILDSEDGKVIPGPTTGPKGLGILDRSFAVTNKMDAVPTGVTMIRKASNMWMAIPISAAIGAVVMAFAYRNIQKKRRRGGR